MNLNRLFDELNQPLVRRQAEKASRAMGKAEPNAQEAVKWAYQRRAGTGQGE